MGRESFVFEKAMYEQIRAAGLSDREEAALYRAIFAHAFGGEEPELSKITRAMAGLIYLIIDQQEEGCGKDLNAPPAQAEDPVPNCDEEAQEA